MNGGGGMARTSDPCRRRASRLGRGAVGGVGAESGDAAAQELKIAHSGAGGLDDGPTDGGVADVEGELERIGFCVLALPGEWQWDGVGHRAAAPQ